MTRPAVTLVAAITLLLGGARPVVAGTHQASVGNYWYQDDRQRDRTKIVVRQGDQITFTVREAAYPPHTVDVDAYGIHSPDLLVGQTFTTPPLKKPGTFRLYCRPHEVRGHHTQLVVQAAAAKTAPPSASPTPVVPSRPGGVAGPKPTVPPPTASPAPAATLTPVGVGTAPPGSLASPPAPDPDSLEALTGHRTSNQAPWTRSLWWLLFAAVPIVGAAVFALSRDAARQREQED